jgi:DNA-nicking Smr family endonuclease
MRKNNKKEQGPGGFSARPFKALKGFVPQAPPAAAPTPPKRDPGGDEDDTDLFLEAVSGAKRIDPSAELESEHRSSGTVRTPIAPDDDKNAELFLKAMDTIGAVEISDPTDHEVGTAPRSSSSRMRQLKRGTIRISQELDLHGCLRDEALRMLEQFISGAAARGQQAVLVITGKGINSPEGPVLQGAVAAWLREQGRGTVAEFFPAPRDRGGSGAFVVFLKQRRS